MTRYELLTFLHIAAAIVWLGAGFLIAVLVFGAERAGDREKAAGHHRDVGWLAPRLFIPASLAVLVFGVLLVIDGPWEFDQLWIQIAIGGWAASFLLGILYFKPEGERIGAIAEERGPADPELVGRLHRVNVIDRVQLTILFVVLADMVIKPTSQDSGAVVWFAVIVAAAIVLAAFALRPRQAA
jgi:uncharacterized membrane protein